MEEGCPFNHIPLLLFSLFLLPPPRRRIAKMENEDGLEGRKEGCCADRMNTLPCQSITCTGVSNLTQNGDASPELSMEEVSDGVHIFDILRSVFQIRGLESPEPIACTWQGSGSKAQRREERRKRRGVDGRERGRVSVRGERGTAQIIGNRWLNKVSQGSAFRANVLLPAK